MRRGRKVLLGALAAALLVLAAALLALHRWLSTDEFRQRVEREAATVLGVPLKLERVGLTLWPLPGVVLDGVALRTRQPLKVERIELRPAWLQLMIGRVAISTLVVQRAVLPQQGIDALLASLQKIRQRDQSAPGDASLQLLPRRTVLEELSWVDARGKAIVIQAEARLDSDALPERLELEVLRGRLQGTRLDLRRSDTLAWELRLQVAGGTVQGRMEVQPPAEAGAEFLLKGQLETREVELSLLTAPEPTEAVRARQPLSGRLEASTTLNARARQPSALLDLLQTQSKFTVRGGMLKGIDLAKAVQTVGVSRGGTTPLDTLSGQVSTRGKAIELQNLAASSGALSATGQVSVSTTQQLKGRVNVDLGGAVGMPLQVGGTVEEPEVSLTVGAKIGAALGTVLMPGVGTGAGASMGGKLGELFGK
ncbi:AsmA family protein [Rhodoferax sp. BAB1]|uniref:AsmA family protein n=1 Tax=Rhodoferax sp. BAB1 TaxID=2741720 RepID=UPI0015762A43|nr:AsmA family protein [Rhodoferax sp. BAB1]QKO23342.1 AsmA family protein [Rhodoferax sp. BAB1]